MWINNIRWLDLHRLASKDDQINDQFMWDCVIYKEVINHLKSQSDF